MVSITPSPKSKDARASWQWAERGPGTLGRGHAHVRQQSADVGGSLLCRQEEQQVAAGGQVLVRRRVVLGLPVYANGDRVELVGMDAGESTQTLTYAIC